VTFKVFLITIITWKKLKKQAFFSFTIFLILLQSINEFHCIVFDLLNSPVDQTRAKLEALKEKAKAEQAMSRKFEEEKREDCHILLLLL